MPKKIFENVSLPIEQPDCCWECPLIGLIPKDERKFGSQETLVCLATSQAMNARIARSRMSAHTSKHPLKRHCDDSWDRWQTKPLLGKYPIRIADLIRYRDPFFRDVLQNEPLRIIFHDSGRRKSKN